MQSSFLHAAASFDALAGSYVRNRLPDARPVDVANAVQSLRDRIDRGELRLDAVMSRLRSETGSGLRKAPTSFGDTARAVRDMDHGRLAANERRFVVDMCSRGFAYRPSDRQAAWLAAIFSRLQRREAA